MIATKRFENQAAIVTKRFENRVAIEKKHFEIRAMVATKHFVNRATVARATKYFENWRTKLRKTYRSEYNLKQASNINI